MSKTEVANASRPIETTNQKERRVALSHQIGSAPNRHSGRVHIGIGRDREQVHDPLASPRRSGRCRLVLRLRVTHLRHCLRQSNGESKLPASTRSTEQASIFRDEHDPCIAVRWKAHLAGRRYAGQPTLLAARVAARTGVSSWRNPSGRGRYGNASRYG